MFIGKVEKHQKIFGETPLFHMGSVLPCHQFSNMTHHNMNLGTCGKLWEITHEHLERVRSVTKKNTLRQVIPTVTSYFVIASGISSGNIYGIYVLTFYSGIKSDILFLHSIWHLF